MERQDHPTGTVPTGEQPRYENQYPANQPWAATGPQQQWAGAPGAPPPNGPGYGTQEPERPKWSTRKTAVVTAIAAAAVLAIGGVAVAHSGGSGTASTSQGPGGQGGFPGGGQGGGFPGGGATSTGLARALHGTFVTESNGSYVTRVMQTGSVTAVSSTSITVKSTDGYTKSYTLADSTTVNGGQSQVSAIETGNTVTVVATEAGAATSVLDQSLATGGQGGGFPGGGAPGQQGGTSQQQGSGTGTGGTT